MLQFENLVIPSLDDVVNESLETIRNKLEVDRKLFVELLNAENKEIFNIVDETLADTVINQVDPGYVDSQAQIFQKNQLTILEEHKEMFHYYFLYVHTSFNVFEKIRKSIDKTELNISDTTLICMYGNLCRMSDEIGNALSNGSIRMALALWRTFYEHVVVGVFLMKQDSPNLFKKFADFSHRDVKKQKDSFDQHRELLKFPPIPTDHETAITNRTEELNTSYGKDFFAEYAWAKDALPVKTRASFYAVETQAEMSRYRPFYIWASNYMHPNFRTITDFRGDNDAIVLEKINQKVIDKQSFIDPMQLTLVIFNIFNDYFLYRYSVNNQYSTNIIVFRKLIERLQIKF